jgi:predicted Rdx family selenoprotein
MFSNTVILGSRHYSRVKFNSDRDIPGRGAIFSVTCKRIVRWERKATGQALTRQPGYRSTWQYQVR